jgi:hypothetical protein
MLAVSDDFIRAAVIQNRQGRGTLGDVAHPPFIEITLRGAAAMPGARARSSMAFSIISSGLLLVLTATSHTGCSISPGSRMLRGSLLRLPVSHTARGFRRRPEIHRSGGFRLHDLTNVIGVNHREAEKFLT